MAREIVAQARPDVVVVQDVPLLVEQGMADLFDSVVVVESPLEQRLERLERFYDQACEHFAALARG